MVTPEMLNNPDNIVRYAGDTYPEKEILKTNGVPIDINGWDVVFRYNKEGTIREIDCKINRSYKGQVIIYPHDRDANANPILVKVTQQMIEKQTIDYAFKFKDFGSATGSNKITELNSISNLSSSIPKSGSINNIGSGPVTLKYDDFLYDADNNRIGFKIVTDSTVTASDAGTINSGDNLNVEHDLVLNQCWGKNEADKIYDYSIIRKKEFEEIGSGIPYEEQMTHKSGKLILLSRV